MSTDQASAEYPDGLREVAVTVARNGGEVQAPGLAHRSCPGLAVTMFPFGAFAVTHIKTGFKLCSPSERASTALLTMSQFAMVADMKGKSWADLDQADGAQLIRDCDSEPVPFDGHTITSSKGTRKMTIGEWFQGVRFTFPSEFPWEEKDPFEMAFENFEKMEKAA